MPTQYDVIIIGSGAGGGTLFHKLALAGKNVLLLERGDYVPRETDNWSTLAVNVKAKYNTKESWFDKDGKPLHPHTNYYVGGNTKLYGAALFRRKRRRILGRSSMPAGFRPRGPSPIARWSPITSRRERLFEVHGAAAGEDPTEPESSGPYPFPRGKP